MSEPANHPDPAAEPSPRPRRQRRWRRRLGWAFLAVVSVLVVVYLLRGWLLAGPLAALVESRLEAALGGDFEIAAVRGDYFTDLVIEELVTVTPPEHGPLRELAAARLEVDYSLWGLLTGDGIAAIERVAAEALVVRIDATVPAAPEREPEDATFPPPWLAELAPDHVPALAVAGHVELRVPLGAPESVAPLELVFAEVAIDGDAGRWQLSSEWSADGIDQGLITATLTGSPGPQWRVSAAAGGLTVTEARLAQAEGAWSAAVDASWWDGTLSGTWQPEDWSLTVAGVDVARAPQGLRRILEQRGWPAPADGSLHLAVKGRGDLATEAGRIDGRIALSDIEYPQVALPALATEFRYRGDDQVLELQDLTAEVPGARVQLARAEFRPGAVQPLPVLEDLHLELRDLAAVVAWTGRDATPWPALAAELTASVQPAADDSAASVWQLAVTGDDVQAEGSGRLGPGWLGPDAAAARVAGQVTARLPTTSLLVAETGGGGSLRAELGGSLGAPRCSLSAEVSEFTLGRLRVAAATADLAFGEGLWSMQELLVQGMDCEVRGHGSYRPQSGALDAHLEATADDLAALAPLLALGEVEAVTGRLELAIDLAGSVRDLGDLPDELRGTARLSGSDLAYGPYAARRLGAAFEFEPGATTLTEFVLEHDGSAAFELAGPAVAQVAADGAWTIARLELHGRRGSRFTGRAEGRGGTLDLLEFQASQIPVGLLLVLGTELPEVGGTWSGEVRFEATDDQLPRLAVSLHSNALTIDGEALDIEVSAWQDADETRIDRCRITGADGLEFAVQARFPIAVTLSQVIERAGQVSELDADIHLPLAHPLLRRVLGEELLSGLAGILQAELRLGAGAAVPEGVIDLGGTELLVDGDALRVSGRVRQSAAGWRTEALQVSGDHGLDIAIEGLWPVIVDFTGLRVRPEALVGAEHGATGFALRGFLPSEHAALQRLLAAGGRPAVSGGLAVDLAVTPAEEVPAIALRLDGRELRIAEVPVALALNARQDAAGLHLEQLALDDGDEHPERGLQVRAHGRAPWAVTDAGLRRTEGELLGEWEGRAPLDHPFFGLLLPPEWRSRGQISTSGRIERGGDAGDRFSAELEVAEVVLGHPVYGSFLREVPPIGASVEFSADVSDGWRLVAEASGPARLSATVTSPQALDLDDPVAWLDALPSAAVTGEGSLTVDGGDWIAYAVPEIALLSGVVTAQGELSGTLAEPDWRVGVRSRGLEISTRTGLPAITDLDVDATLTPAGIELAAAVGDLGYAPFTVSGRIPYRPATGHWDLAVSGDNVLLVQDAHLRLRCDLEVSLTGPGSELTVGGEAGITDLLYSKPIDLFGGGGMGESLPGLQLFSLANEPWASMRFDLAVRDGPLERDWAGASERVRFANNLVRGTAGVDLELGGTGLSPTLDGRITTDDTKVRLPFTVFRVRQAEVVFDPANTSDPRINAEAVSRIQGYEVTVIVSGRLTDLRIDVTTMPHLDRHDALLLATTGLTSADVQQGGRGTAAGVAATYIGRTVLESVFSSRDPDAEPGWWSDVTLEVESGGEQGGLAAVRGEVPLDHPWFLWVEFVNYSQYSVYNGGIGLRFRPGYNEEVDEERAAPTQPRIDGLQAPEWEIVGVPQDLRRRIKRSIRRSKRDYEGFGFPEAAVADAAFMAESYLRGEGYALATVDFRIEPSPERPRRVVLEVDLGARFVFGQVSVPGAHDAVRDYVAGIIADNSVHQGIPLESITERGLQRHAWIYNRRHVDGLADAIENWYRRRGYGQVEVGRPRITYVFGDDAGPQEVDVSLPVTPGQRFVVTDVTVEPSGPIRDDVRADLLGHADDLLDGPYVPHVVRSLDSVLAGELREHGHLHAEVDSSVTIDHETGAVAVTFAVAPGPIYRFRDVRVEWLGSADDRRTTTSYVKYKFTVADGSILRQSAIDAGVRRLLGSGFLPKVETEIRPVSDDGAEDGQGDGDGDPGNGEPREILADLWVGLEEVTARTIDLQLGYGSYDRLIGRLRYTDHNLFGSGRTWEITPEASLRGYSLETRFIDRDLLARTLGPDHRIELTGRYLFREEPTFDRESYEASLLLHKDLGRNYNVDVGYTLLVEQAEEIRGEIPEVERNGFVRSGTLGLDLSADFRDQPLLPTRGWAASVGMSWAGAVFGSEVDFLEYRAAASAYWDITGDGDLVLALGARGMTRDPLDDVVSLPVQFRLFNGGADSVRSFEQNELGPKDADGDAIGGLTRGTASVELRWRITGSSWHIAAFYDIGVVSSDPFTLVENDPGQAVGIGLRYELPVGPIRVDFARGIGERFGVDDEIEVHGAIGFSF